MKRRTFLRSVLLSIALCYGVKAPDVKPKEELRLATYKPIGSLVAGDVVFAWDARWESVSDAPSYEMMLAVPTDDGLSLQTILKARRDAQVE